MWNRALFQKLTQIKTILSSNCLFFSWKFTSMMCSISFECTQSMHLLCTSKLGSVQGFLTARQRSCGKVMFSVVSVHHSVHRGSLVTITHDALDLTIQGPFWSPPPQHGTSLYRGPSIVDLSLSLDWDLTVQGPLNPWPDPPPEHGTSLYRDPSNPRPDPPLDMGPHCTGTPTTPSPGHRT